MPQAKPMLVAALMLMFVLGAASPTRAEWFGSLYLGYGITSSDELTFTQRMPRTFEDVEFRKTAVWGGRAGYWFRENEALGGISLGRAGRYLGADLDFSYFRPRIPSQRVRTDVGRGFLGAMDVEVVTLTPEVLARDPLLVDKEFPQGRLQPYIGLGPAIFITSANDSGAFGPRGGSAAAFGVGFIGRTGVAWHVTENVQLFTEYRFVHASPEFKFTRGPVELTINSHHFNVGVSYVFGR